MVQVRDQPGGPLCLERQLPARVPEAGHHLRGPDIPQLAVHCRESPPGRGEMTDTFRSVLDAALEGTLRIEIDDNGDLHLIPAEPQRLIFTDGKWIMGSDD